MASKRIARLARGAADYSGNASGLAVDSDDNQLKLNADGTQRPIGVCGYGKVLAATATISAADNGATYFLNHATEFVTTLPAPFLGAHYNVIVANAPEAANYTIVSASSANIVLGQVYTTDVNSATDPDFETSGGDTITFVAAKSVVGDRVELFSDGTNWFAYIFVSVFDAATITTAS